jgi:hypothetical protein
VFVSAIEPFGKKPDGVIREKRFSLSEGGAWTFHEVMDSPSSRNAADEDSRPQKGHGANKHAFAIPHGIFFICLL